MGGQYGVLRTSVLHNGFDFGSDRRSDSPFRSAVHLIPSYAAAPQKGALGNRHNNATVVGIGIFLLLIPGLRRERLNGKAGVPGHASTATAFYCPMCIIPLHSLGNR